MNSDVLLEILTEQSLNLTDIRKICTANKEFLSICKGNMRYIFKKLISIHGIREELEDPTNLPEYPKIERLTCTGNKFNCSKRELRSAFDRII